MSRLRQSLALQIFLGMVLGIVVGGIFGKDVQGLKMLGDIFLRLLQMLVVPFVFTVLLTGTASIGNPKDLGRVGVKVLLLYEATSLIAIAVSLAVALAIQPGIGLPKPEGAPPKPPVAPKPAAPAGGAAATPPSSTTPPTTSASTASAPSTQTPGEST